MADARAILSIILYCLWLPTSKILSAIIFILSPFWALAQFILLPAVYLLKSIYAVVSFPFRLHLLERIETIYIWVGVAGLIGCIAGTALFLLFKFLTSAFHIDGTGSASRTSGRTVKEFRATRRVKKEPYTSSPSGRRIDKVAALRKGVLSSQPILEEESEY
ncbi:uncharacterized protein CC84DRAFT_722455 [Paraphaeosphaeria sporulosa]|uniref:Uncharacterized protein n=1 Tax=Paraphaeosphaeria sporulosa TaxID=1460663 RepID=A0A177CEU9_9PLEO|nr:uncharacterized protein CC84DRAFT_722455 [Paraphaeosphaeria sporulosa]OAG05432.1 hypothetical protein CC84DRAFT_722455 [Paraphaeosphaeria sporulosa]